MQRDETTICKLVETKSIERNRYKYRLKFFALILPKIHKIHNTSYIYICMENLDFLSSANMTDVLSSDNGSCKWRRREGGENTVYFHIRRKIPGKVLYENMYA